MGWSKHLKRRLSSVSSEKSLGAMALIRALKPLGTKPAARPYLSSCLAVTAGAYAGWQFRQVRAEEDLWQHHLGKEARLLDLDGLKQKNRVNKQFIWHTNYGPGKIEDLKFYHCQRGDVDREVSLDAPETVEGKTRICAVIRVGNELNGHPGLLHGGFTSAIVDDFTGLASWMEKDAQGLGKNIKVFTAHIDLSYRRPLPVNSEYLVDVCVDKVERQKKVFLNTTIYDKEGHACVKARVLYIIKK